MSSESYRIRTELLVLARDILESQSRAAFNRDENYAGVPFGTKEITTEQIIAEAKKLNNFVSNG